MDEEKRFEDFRSRPSQETLVELLRSCQDTVYTLCFHVLRHSQNAEDASQKVFMTILDQLPRISDAVHFRRWLHTVCLHVSLDLKRKQETPRIHAREVAERATAATVSGHPEIHEHLALLDGEQRSLIIEHYFDRRPLEAMAGRRGCSAVTVWNRLQKALGRLKQSLVEAGVESAAFGLDAFLLKLSPLEAPKDLIGAAVAAKAAEVAAIPLSTSALVLGGTALKTKILATVAVVGLLSLLSMPILRAWGSRTAVVSSESPRMFGRGPRESAVATAVDVKILAPESPAEPDPAGERFATIADFTRAFRKSLFLLNDAERWKTLRKIGIALTDAEFVEVQTRVKYKRGTHAYANRIQALLIEAWTKRDPRAAAAFFRDLPGTVDEYSKQDFLRRALSAWLPVDGSAAVRFAEILPEGTGRTRLLNHLSALQDPASFAARIPSLRDEERFKSLEDLADAWTAVDPSSSIRWFSELPAPNDRSHFLGRALSRWAERDLTASLEWPLRLPSDATRDELLRQALSRGAANHPREASEFALKLLKGSDPATPSVMNGIAMAWLERDVAQGLQFADQLEERTLLIARAAELDPAQTLAWVNRRPESEDRPKLLEALFKGWALSDRSTPQEALEAARTLPEAVRIRAIQGLLVGMCDFDPAGACAFAAGVPPAAVPFDSLGERFAYQDMAAAASWARTLPDPGSRDQAITGILRLAQNWDLSMAISLAREVSAADARCQAFTHLLDWAINVKQNGRSAEVRMQGVLCAWLQTDPQAPAQWADQAILSPELKSAAYKVVGDPRRRAPSKR